VWVDRRIPRDDNIMSVYIILFKGDDGSNNTLIARVRVYLPSRVMIYNSVVTSY